MEWDRYSNFKNANLASSLEISIWNDGTVIISPDDGGGSWTIDINDLREVIEEYDKLGLDK